MSYEYFQVAYTKAVNSEYHVFNGYFYYITISKGEWNMSSCVTIIISLSILYSILLLSYMTLDSVGIGFKFVKLETKKEVEEIKSKKVDNSLQEKQNEDLINESKQEVKEPKNAKAIDLETALDDELLNHVNKQKSNNKNQ